MPEICKTGSDILGGIENIVPKISWNLELFSSFSPILLPVSSKIGLSHPNKNYFFR